MAGGMAFYHYSTDLMKASTHKRIAVEIANAEMEKIKKERFPAGGLWQTYSPTVTIAGLTGTQTINVSDVTGVSYKKVSIAITWIQPGRGNQNIQLETYIAP